MPEVHLWQQKFINKTGIEIGGPSAIFKSSVFLLLYKTFKSLDGVNFSKETVWEVESRKIYLFYLKIGMENNSFLKVLI